MVSSTGGCGCFLGAAGGCGCWGCGRGSLGLPRSRCRSAPSGVGLRFSRVLRKCCAQTTTAPTVRRLPRPAVARMRRFYIYARAWRTLAARDSISSVLHAASNPFCPGVFSDLRDTEAKRTAQRSPNTPRVLRAESRAIFSCVKRLHTANKQGALCERCVTARRRRAFHTRNREQWAAAKQSTASPTTTRGRCTRTTRTAGDSCGCET